MFPLLHTTNVPIDPHNSCDLSIWIFPTHASRQLKNHLHSLTRWATDNIPFPMVHFSARSLNILIRQLWVRYLIRRPDLLWSFLYRYHYSHDRKFLIRRHCLLESYLNIYLRSAISGPHVHVSDHFWAIPHTQHFRWRSFSQYYSHSCAPVIDPSQIFHRQQYCWVHVPRLIYPLHWQWSVWIFFYVVICTKTDIFDDS